MRRKTSYHILERVINQKQHAHLLLKELDLDPQDQAFISALVYSTLQNKLYLEYQLQQVVRKKPQAKLQVLLIMAACEALIMDNTPDYAVVNEYVELSKHLGFRHQSGFVNKVLKLVVENGPAVIDKEGLEKVSIEKSMPLWILNLLKSQYGEAFASDYANYVQEIKPNYGWENALKPHQDTNQYLTDGIVDSNVFKTDLIQDAHIVVQDINSQRVVDLMPLEKGMHVLDCCCAPGTKTLRIANKLENTGNIIGLDLVASRVKVTEALMERSGVKNATIIEGDATTQAFDSEFDAVLIDAPCSGLGVLSHKHDLRYNIQPEDLDDLQNIQRDILDNISQYVKVGGHLVYATCTLNKKENEKQVSAFLKRNMNYAMVYEETMHPMDTMGDGFYVALLKRT